MKHLTLMTLTWNAKDKLEKLYRSILPALDGLNWRWAIRDNGSVDNTAEMVESWNDNRITIVKHNNNLANYSQGNNALFKLMFPNNESITDNDYLLLLNNDIVFKDDVSINNMLNIIDNDNEIGVVGCKLNYEDNPNIIQHAGVLFHPANVGTPYHYRAGRVEEERDRKNRYYPIVTGAVLLTKAKLFADIGGLNEKLNWSWDDSYYCMDVSQRGKKIVYCGKTNILHSESASLKKNPVNKLFFKQNLQIFINAWQNKIDKQLVQKYDKDPNFALYKD